MYIYVTPTKNPTWPFRTMHIHGSSTFSLNVGLKFGYQISLFMVTFCLDFGVSNGILLAPPCARRGRWCDSHPGRWRSSCHWWRCALTTTGRKIRWGHGKVSRANLFLMYFHIFIEWYGHIWHIAAYHWTYITYHHWLTYMTYSHDHW